MNSALLASLAPFVMLFLIPTQVTSTRTFGSSILTGHLNENRTPNVIYMPLEEWPSKLGEVMLKDQVESNLEYV